MLSTEELAGVSFDQYRSYIEATFPTADRIVPVRSRFPALYEFARERLYRLTVASGEPSDDSPTTIPVVVTLTTLDLLTVTYEVGERYPEVELSSLSDDEANIRYELALAELYGNSEPPTTRISFEIKIVVEDDGLFVDHGIRFGFEMMRAGEIAGEAWTARNEGRTEWALMLYRQAVALDPETSFYQDELDSLTTRFDELTRTIDFAPSGYARRSLVLRDVSVDLTGSVEFLGTLENRGNRRIGWLEIRIVYRDQASLLMDVEILRHRFEDVLPGGVEATQRVRFEATRAPYAWDGQTFELTVLDAGL